MELADLPDDSFSLSKPERDFSRRISDVSDLPDDSISIIEEKVEVGQLENPIPSFRKMLFPIKPATAANAIYSPMTDIASAKRRITTSSSTRPEPHYKPRVKTKYELFREKKYMQNYQSSLADTQTKHEKHKGSIRFSIGDAALELDMNIAALCRDDFAIFEENPDSDDQEDGGNGKKDEKFDLEAFLVGLKRPKAAVRNLKASRVDELKAKIEEHGSVQEGLSKEECLYYIEAFIAIDADESGEITEQELFEGIIAFLLNVNDVAMDTLNMDCSIEKVREMIKTVDVNGDGNVSVDEFLKLMANIRSKITFLQSQDQMEFAFNLIDRDQDNYIGVQDLMALFDEIEDKDVDFNSCKKMLHAVIGESFSARKSEEPKVNFSQFAKLVKAIGQ